eukprot:TRINITY_DN38337_c0_g3_i1.p1 TRINITY_DN38337_c0_g3~~TRINITY_DN38337_c0_g3_i1.p1  ORF type:complete len:567 (-),score=147.22 TRINITY_DN38337_c0_g3_i1:329-2029(-)
MADEDVACAAASHDSPDGGAAAAAAPAEPEAATSGEGAQAQAAPEEQPVELVLLCLRGEEVTRLTVGPSQTIRQVKKVLSERLELPLFRQRLVRPGSCAEEVPEDAVVGELQPEERRFQLIRLNFDPTKGTKLFRQVRAGDFAATEGLLRAMADPCYQRSKDGATALHLACREGHLEVAKLLVEASCDPKIAMKNGNTALHLATKETAVDAPPRPGRDDCVKFLTEFDLDLDQPDHEGWTPLHLAVQNTRVDSVRALCAAKADVNIVMQDGLTPLHVSALKDSPDMVRVLCQAGADKDKPMQESVTPLIVASMQGNLPVAKALCECGCDKMKSQQDGVTPIIVAAKQGHLDMVEFLAESGCDTNCTMLDGTSPLRAAAQYGHAEVVRYLCQAGANVNAMDKHGRSSLMIACRQGFGEVVKALIDHGVDVNLPGEERGWTPLAIAAGRRQNFNIAKMLLEAKANPCPDGPPSACPMNVAYQHGHHEIAELIAKAAGSRECFNDCKRHTAQSATKDAASKLPRSLLGQLLADLVIWLDAGCPRRHYEAVPADAEEDAQGPPAHPENID